MSERHPEPRDVGDKRFGDSDFGDQDLFDALARAGLPTPPSLDLDRRAMIAAELARLDLTLAPARARSAAFRRIGGWTALIVVAIVLLWAFDMRRDGSNVLDGDPGAGGGSGTGSDQVEPHDLDTLSPDGTVTGSSLATAGDTSDRDDGSSRRDHGTAVGDSGGAGADADAATEIGADSSGGASRGGIIGSTAACAFEPAADRILGQVVDAGGAPLADMTLLVYEVDASTARYFGASDDNGCFSLSSVRSGRYRIEVESTLDAGRGDGSSADALATALLTIDGVRPTVPLYLRVR